MSRPPGSTRVRVAFIALAGTIGAMGMLGHRRGGVLEIFAAGGHQVFPGAPGVRALLVGVVIHALWMLLWAVILAALARRHGGTRAAIGALVVAAIAFAVSTVLPGPVVGPVATLAAGERALVHVVLAIALLIGVRVDPAGDEWVV